MGRLGSGIRLSSESSVLLQVTRVSFLRGFSLSLYIYIYVYVLGPGTDTVDD